MRCLSIKGASRSVSFASGMLGFCDKVGVEDHEELGLREVYSGSGCEDHKTTGLQGPQEAGLVGGLQREQL